MKPQTVNRTRVERRRERETEVVLTMTELRGQIRKHLPRDEADLMVLFADFAQNLQLMRLANDMPIRPPIGNRTRRYEVS